jgi:hypothetical protein
VPLCTSSSLIGRRCPSTVTSGREGHSHAYNGHTQAQLLCDKSTSARETHQWWHFHAEHRAAACVVVAAAALHAMHSVRNRCCNNASLLAALGSVTDLLPSTCAAVLPTACILPVQLQYPLMLWIVCALSSRSVCVMSERHSCCQQTNTRLAEHWMSCRPTCILTTVCDRRSSSGSTV